MLSFYMTSKKKGRRIAGLFATIFFLAAFSGCAYITNISQSIFPPAKPAPPQIEGLKIKSLDEESLTLQWIAPGGAPVPTKEECFYGARAKKYSLRYGDTEITENNWDDKSLEKPSRKLFPHKKNFKEKFTVRGLKPDTQYNLGIRYIIKNKCTDALETSELSVISFRTLKEIKPLSREKDKLRPTPLKLGSLRRKGYQVVPVLAYHDITEDPKKITDTSLDNFYEQMKYLYDNGYTTITAKQLYNFMNVKSRIPRKSVVLTFDDGYQSIHRLVSDILKKFKLHGIAFVYTDAVEGKYKATMSWEQIKEVSKGPFEIQLHTKSHSQYLASYKEGETEEQYHKRMDKEVLFAQNMIYEKIGKKPEFLAYPYGKFSERLIYLLRDRYDFKGAFTVVGAGGEGDNVVGYGYNTFFSNPFKVLRVQILKNTGLNKFKRFLKSFKPDSVMDESMVKSFNREIGQLNKKASK